ncbi:MAG: SDR family oxidoreductase [Desulfobulbaceae bacterium]|nr:SDR family oxidoreductase [Desulfobulbaceae bacterium]
MDQTRILITGATGYIGRRLKNRLLAHPDYQLRLFVRNKRKVGERARQSVEIVEGDTFNKEKLALALVGIDVAFYLIHSMGADKDFKSLDRTSAENFRDACIAAGVNKIIYLGGLGVKETASKHLLSRIETGEILSARPNDITTIWFRAGVIIGSGSASFEIIRNLAQKLPFMLAPRWVNTKTQPIAVDDVLSYLEESVSLENTGNTVVDIGTDIMSFREMMIAAGRAMGLKRFIIPVPVLSPRLSSYWLVLITTVPFKMAAPLVEGLKSETVQQNDNAALLFPKIKPMSFENAVQHAIDEIEKDQVVSRWCDSSAGEVCDIIYQDDPSSAIIRDRRMVEFGNVSPDKVFRSALAIGGERGWYKYNVLWRLRGAMDKMVGGYGLTRGRRVNGELRIGDALDFWKVADIKPNKRLLLLAQMKLPGKAWLEFIIEGNMLIQTAHFYPRGILGRLYWYSTLIFHNLVFQDLIEKIVEHAKQAE